MWGKWQMLTAMTKILYKAHQKNFFIKFISSIGNFGHIFLQSGRRGRAYADNTDKARGGGVELMLTLADKGGEAGL